MERAKELFLEYHGNRFYMDRDGAGREYDGYRISRETERMWAEEYVRDFLESEAAGREALRAYATAADLLSGREAEEDWKKCLYFPLRSRKLDDVTVLFMLPGSFRMAEKAAGRGRFSKEDADAYLRELDGYVRRVRERADSGTLTRNADYTMLEFSDPVYAGGYLDGLRKKWTGLFRQGSGEGARAAKSGEGTEK